MHIGIYIKRVHNAMEKNMKNPTINKFNKKRCVIVTEKQYGSIISHSYDPAHLFIYFTV